MWTCMFSHCMDSGKPCFQGCNGQGVDPMPLSLISTQPMENVPIDMDDTQGPLYQHKLHNLWDFLLFFQKNLTDFGWIYVWFLLDLIENFDWILFHGFVLNSGCNKMNLMDQNLIWMCEDHNHLLLVNLLWSLYHSMLGIQQWEVLGQWREQMLTSFMPTLRFNILRINPPCFNPPRASRSWR